MKELNLLAIDIGASNGRGIVGVFDGNTLHMEDVCRFENSYVERGDMLYWDIEALYESAQRCISEAVKTYGRIDSFGIDTWGVDYGLLDENGRLIGQPRCYRHATQQDVDAVHAIVPQRELFDHTGIASLTFNTVYQLYRRVRENDPELAKAKTLLLMPDLLGYLLTGVKKSEYTNVTTMMLYDPVAKDWDYSAIDKLGLSRGLFTSIDRAGVLRGRLKAEVAAGLGVERIPYAATGSHDTASAVAAIPGSGSFAFISSGTWSLFGTETDVPLMSDAVFDANFSNEGTVQGGFRPLKNIIGMWLIQECRRKWLKETPELSWDEIVVQARAAEPFRSLIDPDCQVFFSVGDMPEHIREYCRNTGQPVPETVGQTARCIYESLALKYRWAIERLEEIKGQSIDSYNIVGGGAKNKLLNQMTADAADRKVVAGPYEGTAMGSLLVQAQALGALKDIDDIRRVVKNSAQTETYEPHTSPEWEAAYSRFLRLLNTPGVKQ